MKNSLSLLKVVKIAKNLSWLVRQVQIKVKEKAKKVVEIQTEFHHMNIKKGSKNKNN